MQRAHVGHFSISASVEFRSLISSLNDGNVSLDFNKTSCPTPGIHSFGQVSQVLAHCLPLVGVYID